MQLLSDSHTHTHKKVTFPQFVPEDPGLITSPEQLGTAESFGHVFLRVH